MLLHIGGTSAAGVAAVIAVIFLLIFAMSFAFGPVPEGERKFSRPWIEAWTRATAPRFAVAALFAGAVLAANFAWGNSSSSAAACDTPLAPFTGGAVTDARLLTAIGSLNEMAAAADEGDQERVRTLFFTEDAHNLTHDIDRPLRDRDEGAARKLCGHVIILENQIGGDLNLPAISQATKDIASDLQAARSILSAVSSPVITNLEPCAQPLQAITTDQLSKQRLQSAIDKLREVSQLAASGDETGAQTAFAGDPHNLTHDIDVPLRNVDQDLAVSLCESILAIETHLGDKYDAEVIQAEAARSADHLQDAGEVLGILP